MVHSNAAIALASSAFTAFVIFVYQRLDKQSRLNKLRKEFTSDEYLIQSIKNSTNQLPQLDNDELLREQLTRNESFFGTDNLDRIKKSFVIVVGLGGVGSHAAVHLLRSGVMNLRLIDFDQVTLSSLNRHATAVRADVGTPKVLAIKKHLLTIFPNANIDACVDLFTIDKAALHLSGQPDFVLDCIDNIHTKIDLLAYCHENKIPIISSMGSACKADPSRVQIADISSTSEDKLAKSVRSRLKRKGINSGIPVIYSTEKPQVKILGLHDEASSEPKEFATLPSFRVRILPVLGALPAIFGASMASYVLCKIGQFNMEPLMIKNRHSMNQRIYASFLNKQQQLYNPIDKDNGDDSPGVRINVTDANLLIDEVWCNKSAISGKLDHLTLCRWNVGQPSTIDNVILMTADEANAHESIAYEDLESFYSKDVLDLITRRFQFLKDLLAD